jgi:hypothetical protein
MQRLVDDRDVEAERLSGGGSGNNDEVAPSLRFHPSLALVFIQVVDACRLQGKTESRVDIIRYGSSDCRALRYRLDRYDLIFIVPIQLTKKLCEGARQRNLEQGCDLPRLDPEGITRDAARKIALRRRFRGDTAARRRFDTRGCDLVLVTLDLR